MKNKEIALRVGTTEQVVKNYLRKVYDKLGVADRLELALYCLNHRVIEGAGMGQARPQPAQPANENSATAPETPNAAAAVLPQDPAPDSFLRVQSFLEFLVLSQNRCVFHWK